MGKQLGIIAIPYHDRALFGNGADAENTHFVRFTVGVGELHFLLRFQPFKPHMQRQIVGIAELGDKLHGFDGIARVIEVQNPFLFVQRALDDAGAGFEFAFNVERREML